MSNKIQVAGQEFSHFLIPSYHASRTAILKLPKRGLKSSKKVNDTIGNIEPKAAATRVFLYLQPTNISYPESNRRSTPIDIKMKHGKSIITRLSDSQGANNAFNVNVFETEKPTFTITIAQDDIDDITTFSDAPLTITLYEVVQDITTDESGKLLPEPLTVRTLPLAQGHIDLLQFFLKKRSKSSVDVFLYPVYPDLNSVTCKTKWDIYSLMPLLKNVKFSNAIFIAFTSIYNVDDAIMNDCSDLVATLSLQSKVPNAETGRHDKIFICKYTAFTKKIISQQTLCYKWENLKESGNNDYSTLGISSAVHFNLNKLLVNILGTEYVQFHVEDINFNDDYALICNSLHRFILTDQMQNDLEQHLIYDQQEIVVEVYNESQPENVLLTGAIDISIFLYPEVKSASFAVALKPPTLTAPSPRPASAPSQHSQINSRRSTKSKKHFSFSLETKMGTESEIKTLTKTKTKTTFAVIRVCLKAPITNPAVDLNTFFNVDDMEREIYTTCWATKSMHPPKWSEEQQLTEGYDSFDDTILQLRNYIVKNNIQLISQDKGYFCDQSQSLTNHILALVAHDFNKRYPTKTNIEFKNLVTTVYKELVERVYHLIDTGHNLYPSTAAIYIDMQPLLINRMTIVKFLYEIGNSELAAFLMEQLEQMYGKRTMFRFYKFLYALEKNKFELAETYIKRPLPEKDSEGEFFTDIIQIYLNYLSDIQSPSKASQATENLLSALTSFCKFKRPKFQTGWMLLYCIYKKYQYQPGISYARYQFENLTESLFLDLMYIPRSLWEIYNEFVPKFKTERGQYFWKGIILLLRLGLYMFAEWLFDEVANECSEAEKYIMKCSFALRLNKVDANYAPRKFILGRIPNAAQVQASLHLVQGNLLWHMNPQSSRAIHQYGSILNIYNLNDTFPYQLGILRYAYQMIAKENYEDALLAFDFASNKYDHNLITASGKALALFRLNRLRESIKYFAEVTKFNMYLPNVWAYLALIHLKLGENYEALECWKYAKLKPEYVIHEEILQELKNFNYNDIFLYIDVP